MALSPPPAFSGALLDRVTVERRDPEWVAGRRGDPASRAIAVSPDEVLILEENGTRALARVDLRDLDDGRTEPILLGTEEGSALFAVDLEGLASPVGQDRLADMRALDLREAAAVLPQSEGGLAAYAAMLLNWHRRHRHCGVCGERTSVEEAGLLRRCPRCGATHHPRLDPVVIMLVVDGDRVLLGRQRGWPQGFFSALAGFVEPGESLEEAVVREVREEARVGVRDPRYVASQPWPFPSSLMLGFEVDHAEGEPAVGDAELDEVRWFTRAEIAAARTIDRLRPEAAAPREGIAIPPPLAIARRLIDLWMARSDSGVRDR